MGNFRIRVRPQNDWFYGWEMVGMRGHPQNDWFYGWVMVGMRGHPQKGGFYGWEPFRMDLMVTKGDES